MSTRIPDEVQVIEPPGPGRRRHYTAQEKLSFLQEAEAPGSSISAIARRYRIAPSQLFRWRRFRDKGTLTSLGAGEAAVPESEVRALQAQVRELQRLLGKKTLEAEILREAIEIGRQKTLLSRSPSRSANSTVISKHGTKAAIRSARLLRFMTSGVPGCTATSRWRQLRGLTTGRGG